jgi:hypothetical protein
MATAARIALLLECDQNGLDVIELHGGMLLIAMRERKTPRVPLHLPDLTHRVDIFRLTGGVRRDAHIDAWLNAEPIELRAIARKWFMHLRQCGNDVRELMHDGCPTACVADAAFGYVNSFKSHVGVGFFYGAFLEDPAGLLEGSGKRMRHVKLSPALPLNEMALSDLINSACVDIRTRLAHDAS